jgi:gas vesicle protein
MTQTQKEILYEALVGAISGAAAGIVLAIAGRMLRKKLYGQSKLAGK